MNDLATLKSLTEIKPIATLMNKPRGLVPFNKIKLERCSIHGATPTGLFLTVSKDVQPDVNEWLRLIHKPAGRVTIHRVVTRVDLQCFQLPRNFTIRRKNYAVMLSDDRIVFDFKYARLQDHTYLIEDLQEFFHTLRLKYMDYVSEGRTVHRHTASIGSVKVRFNSLQAMEDTLYSMAYHFYTEDTEL